MSRRCDKCQWDECVCVFVWRGHGSVIFVWHFSASALLEERCKDAGRWRVLVGGGSLPCAHTAAPSRPSSTRPQVGCLGHTSLTHCSSREADLPHTQMVYSPGLQRYHQFGVWGDFSGANYFLWCLWGTGDVPPQGSIQFIIPKEKAVCREKVVGIVVGQFVVGTSCPV